MTQEIKTKKFEGLLVKVPDEAHAPTISKDGWLYWEINGSRNTGQEELPYGQWKLIGNPFELSDELLAIILPDTFEKRRFSHWIDILSSLQVYKENPYGDKPEFVFNENGKSPIEFARFEADMFKWQEKEERTGNWILIEKIG